MVNDRLHIILASNSPRRRELLAGLGVDFQVKVLQDIDESYPADLSMEEIPAYISRQKAAAYKLQDDELLITADTIVWMDGQVLGKPHDDLEACQMLRKLSGRMHQVVTGVTLRTNQKETTFCCVSDVMFGELTEEEITYYVSRYKPMDKAGSYGIQEWIGYIGVIGIRGSYFNVMGLPIQRLYAEIKKSFPQYCQIKK